MATLTPAASEALRRRLAHRKGRSDIEILGVVGVRPEWVYDYFGSVPGLAFEVQFTFTSGRRQRRTDSVGFRVLSNGGDHSPIHIPPALLQFLADAVATV